LHRKVADFNGAHPAERNVGDALGLAGVISPAASAAMTAPIAGARSAGVSIGGSAKARKRSRRGASNRSTQTFCASALPDFAVSTVLDITGPACS
jgi:hypothetical protein